MTQSSSLGCDVDVSLCCERVWCEIVVTPRIATPPPTGVSITSVNKHEVSPVVCLVGCPTFHSVCRPGHLVVPFVVLVSHLSFHPSAWSPRCTICRIGVPLVILLSYLVLLPITNRICADAICLLTIHILIYAAMYP